MNFTHPYNQNDFLDFLRIQFLPEDFVSENKMVSLPTKMQYISQASKLGHCDSLDLVVYEIRHTSYNDARVGLTKEAFRLLADEWESRALVLFVPQDNIESYRFSLITIELTDTDEGRIKKQFSNPRRFSYVFGTALTGERTPQDYLVKKGRVRSLEDLVSRFDVEILTKEFYNKLYSWYEWACDNETGVTFPNKVSTADDDRENINVKMIRLITRMLFVWFIKQKKLVPDTIFNETELVYILKNFNPKAIDDGCYYNAILQNLFFATINRAVIDSEGNRRSFATAKNQHDVRNLYRYAEMFCISEDEVIELFEKVPFLNGGLFECLDKFHKTDLLKEEDVLDDGFSRNSTRSGNGNYKYRAFIPNILFFNDDETHLGLINLFKRFNFTIEENAPNDVDVSLDPELLGKVFENLLASYNPETQASARKSTGSFYTPREIVDYMVDQSLIAHVSQHCPSIDKEKLSTFVTNLDTPEVFSDEEKCQIVEALRTIKILDPACGSGAFPMGCLRHIVDTIERLRPTQTDRYQLKLDIIENCIYGVDIQPIAMLISKLRFFISLICDQHDIDFDDPENNYGINTLPNLETKFVAANTLISAQIRSYGTDFVDKGLKKLLDDLLEIRHEHFSAKSQYAKKKYREADESKRKEIEEYIIKNSYTPNEDLIKMLEQQIRESEANLLKYQGENWVDETQGSQTELFGPYNKTIFHVDKNEEKRKELKKNISACRSQITKEKGKTIPQGFEAAVHEVSQWNPYDQNAVSPFFDPEWMFGVKEGFDLVIGNPPYLRIQGIRETAPSLADYLVDKYQSATGSFDMYACFAERALQLVNYDNRGIVSFIMPTKWTNAAFGKGLRTVISKQKAASRIINFGAYQVFNASTYTGLQWFQPESDSLQYAELDQNLYTNTELSNYLTSLSSEEMTSISNVKLGSDIWTLTTGPTVKILNELEKQPRRVGNVFNEVFQGLATSKDSVYFLQNCIEEDDFVEGNSEYLDRRVRIEKGLVRPLLKGDDVHRYDIIRTNRFVIFPYQIINGKAILFSENELETKFPLGYAYLKECEDVLRDREHGRFNVDGEWFQFGRKQGMKSATIEKLVAPDISMSGNFAYDAKGNFYQTTTIYGYIKRSTCEDSYKILMAILNSHLCWWYLSNTGTTLANGYFRYKPDYIKPFPIPSSEAIHSAQPIIENLVDCITYLHNNKTDNIYSHTSNERLEYHFNEILDMVIYELYFGEHMKENKIDVIADFENSPLVKDWQDIRTRCEKVYSWYQTSENPIRQKLLLLDIRSKDKIYFIHSNARTYEQN